MRARAGLLALAGALLSLQGCARGIPEAPAPVPVPSAPEPPVLVVHSAPPPLIPPPYVALDPILHSRWARHPDLLERVEYWSEVFARRDGEWFRTYLTRMSRYAPHVDSVLLERELPASLRYLPIVESGYLPVAVSPAAAVGMWQFMSPVARSFGLQVDPLIDERRDPVVATAAATQFLGELHDRFDSWFLALAAYNGGPTRVDRLIRQHAPLAPRGDSLFLVIAPYLPRETQDFVPKFLAAAELARSADRLGLAPLPEDLLAPLAFDQVEVPDATSLDIVAAAAGVSEAEIFELNPHVVRGVTPRGRSTRLRLPVGAGGTFSEVFATIPEDERVSVTEHVVAPGETLSEIAESYGIRTAELQAANPGLDPRRLQIGTRLMVPIAPGAAERIRRGGEAAPAA